MEELGLSTAFYQELSKRVVHTLKSRYPDKFQYTILMSDFDGEKLSHYKEDQ